MTKTTPQFPLLLALVTGIGLVALIGLVGPGPAAIGLVGPQNDVDTAPHLAGIEREGDIPLPVAHS